MNIDKYYILVTEGITDCSLLEAMFEKYMGYSSFEKVKDLPQLFQDMIGTYPTITGELKRQDSPTFYFRDNIGIAIKQANGYSQIPQKISMLIENIDKLDLYDKFAGFLIFCDTDLKSKEEITDIFVNKFKENEVKYENNYLQIYDNQIKCNMYLFPNDGQGAVEKLLLDCAEISYSKLFYDAETYKDKIMLDDYQDIRSKCWAKDIEVQKFYSEKVHFGAISSVLKPDRPVRFTIKDKIIRPELFNDYMKLPEFMKLYNFLLKTIT